MQPFCTFQLTNAQIRLPMGTKWLPPRGTCEDAEKNCEEKELPQPMNKKSEIQ